MTSHELAYHILRGGLALSLILSVFLIIRLFARRHEGLILAEAGQHLITACLTAASAILVYAFITHDFSNAYVASYSDRTLPLFYRITAFWGGQDGSLLFWAWSIAVSGSVFALTPAYRRLTTETRFWFWLFFFGIMGFFFLLLSGWSNPFMMLDPVPHDGRGLNPLLQNPGMILHPPLLFLGYGGFTIPACLALGQHLSQNRAEEGPWISVTRPITMGAWVLLSAGILLGMWWAYMELGWGGYWAWDPVENASLIPWLVATGFLHTAVVEVKRGKLFRLNVFLIAMTTLSAFFATYLTRSGIIQSVHAFGSTSISLPLLLFMLLLLTLSVVVVASRQKERGKPMAAIDSREGFLLLIAWAFIALSLIVLAATIWPVLRTLTMWLPALISGLPMNRYLLLLIGLVLLLALVELLAWKAARAARLAEAHAAIAGEKAAKADVGALRVFSFALLILLILLAAAPFISSGSVSQRVFGPDGGLLAFGQAVKAVGGKVFEADFYNRTCLPLFIFIGLLLCLCPWQRWKGGLRSPKATVAVLAALVAGGIAVWLSQSGIMFQSAGLPTDAELARLVQTDPMMASTVRAAARQVRVLTIIAAAGGGVALACLVSLALQICFDPAARKDPRSRMAWAVHLGLALVLLGAAFSGPYKQELEGSLPIPGFDAANTAPTDAAPATLQLGAYTIQLDRLEDLVSVVLTPGADPVVVPRSTLAPEYFQPFRAEAANVHYESLRAVLSVSREGKPVGTLSPERRRYPKFGEQRFTEASTSFSLADELYATLSGTQNGRAYIMFSVHPLVNWLWIGGIIMCFAPLLGLVGRRKK